jgi:NADH-quinone oxidoreductase subunit N
MDLVKIFPLTALGSIEFSNLLPLIILSFGAVLALLAGTHKERGNAHAFFAAVFTLVLSIGAALLYVFDGEYFILGRSLVFSPFTKSLNLMCLFFALLAVLLTYGQDKKEGLLSEIYGLILFSTAGMMMMVSTNHLLFMFIALEIMSLAIYVLVAMRRSSRFSAEAGLKYFILGGLASALFLYGSSLVFGAIGSFDLSVIRNNLTGQAPSFIYFVGLGLIMASMFFKVGAFPFHSWVPDVYQGASTNVTGFMGAAVKFTAFMAFANIARHMIFVDNVQGLEWFRLVIWVVSAASMIYGNLTAISQFEIKRMLSFSTIAHSGYLLMGLYAMDGAIESSQSLVLYLFFYALTNLGAFAVISLLEKKNQKDLTLDELAGAGVKYPLHGALFTVFLLSMAGIPLTSGFIGKYGLFNSTVMTGEVPLVIIAVLTSVVSVYYYLRVIVYMFMKDSTEVLTTNVSRGASIVALVSAFFTLQFGLFPRMIIQLVKIFAR